MGPKLLRRHGGQEKDLAARWLMQHMGLRPGSLFAAVDLDLMRRGCAQLVEFGGVEFAVAVAVECRAPGGFSLPGNDQIAEIVAS